MGGMRHEGFSYRDLISWSVCKMRNWFCCLKCLNGVFVLPMHNQWFVAHKVYSAVLALNNLYPALAEKKGESAFWQTAFKDYFTQGKKVIYAVVTTVVTDSSKKVMVSTVIYLDLLVKLSGWPTDGVGPDAWWPCSRVLLGGRPVGSSCFPPCGCKGKKAHLNFTRIDISQLKWTT